MLTNTLNERIIILVKRSEAKHKKHQEGKGNV